MPATNLLQEVRSQEFGTLTCVLSVGLASFIESEEFSFKKMLLYMLIWHGMTLKASCISYDIVCILLNYPLPINYGGGDMYANMPNFVILSGSIMKHLLDKILFLFFPHLYCAS
jgi:hypothetical protein